MTTSSIPPLFCPRCGAPDRDPERWCFLCGAPPMRGEPIVASLANEPWPDRGTSPWKHTGDILAWIVMAIVVVGVALIGIAAFRDNRADGYILFAVVLLPVLITLGLSLRDALRGMDQGPTKALARLAVSAVATFAIVSALVTAIVVAGVVAVFVMCFSPRAR